jgi:hypothetical protein
MTAALAPIRWGARERRDVPAFGTVTVAQFVDLKLLAPQELAIALYATLAAPIPGISVRWIVSWGAGSISHVERRTVAASDVEDQDPLLLRRPASSVQVEAIVVSTVPEIRAVTLDVLIAPVSPTWQTEIVCP